MDTSFGTRKSDSGIDPLTLEYAEKGLTLFHILLILILNLLVLYRVYKETRGRGVSPRLLLIVSLSIGDMFLALFHLSVHAIGLFDAQTYISLPCSTTLSATAYAVQVHPFAYCFLLVAMGVEILRRKTPTDQKGKRILVSLAYSASPWFLALIIALPVGIAGIDMFGQKCYGTFTLDHLRAQVICCILIPAGIAVVMSIVVKHSRSVTLTESQQGVPLGQMQSQFEPHHGQQPLADQQQLFSGHQQPLSHQQQPFSKQPYPIHQQQYTGQQQPNADQQQPYIGQQTYIGQQPYAGHEQPNTGQQQPFSGQQAGEQLYTGQQPSIGQQALTGQQAFTVQQAFTGQQVPPALDLAPVDIEREKNILLTTSLVTFFFSLPFAVMTLVFLTPGLEIGNLTFVVLVEICNWLFYARCLVTATCWLASLKSLRTVLRG